MTKRFVSVLSAVTLVAVLSPLAVSLGAAEITCQVPFSFAVNGAPLPAGRYTVSTQDRTLVFRGLTRAAIVLGQPAQSPTRTTPKLVFDKQGGDYTAPRSVAGRALRRRRSRSRGRARIGSPQPTALESSRLSLRLGNGRHRTSEAAARIIGLPPALPRPCHCVSFDQRLLCRNTRIRDHAGLNSALRQSRWQVARVNRSTA